ncbi:DUF4403 family protein [Sphingomonas sp. dw_22]|uniref:DUF4403 family protein n=1 Tax=Sphingomonas sp. dw_22 TaxID=2721175 RepID=UPI0021168017|nr:DUF4403 family protein [Sphingomonas sp. dw_22]
MHEPPASPYSNTRGGADRSVQGTKVSGMSFVGGMENELAMCGLLGRLRRYGHCSWVLALLLLMPGCRQNVGNPAPPRIDTAVQMPQQSSNIVVPVIAQLAEIENGLNRRTPRILWQIDRREPRCVPAQRVKVFARKVKVTPDLSCRIVGQVTRGRIRLGGSGDTLTITLLVSATISARDVGGIIRQETATGAATVRALAKLSVDSNWSPIAKVDIAYDWTDPPGIDLLGQRIRFTGKADEKLKSVIAGLERDLPRELARAHLRDQLSGVWKQGFTSIMLNRERPPVWMRVTPRRLGFGGYRVSGRQLEIVLAAEALTETFVGSRPPDPKPTPLPSPSRASGPEGLRFFIPVLADFEQLEPVVERALGKLAKKGITLTGIGPVDAKFGKVTIYATEGGRLAVGIKAEARKHGGMLASTRGEIWLSAVPYNDVNSQIVKVRDLKIAGQTDSKTVNLLFALFGDQAVLGSLRASLTHDFGRDYQKVLVAARKAIAEHREGDFILSADVSTVVNGPLKVTGQGLFLPVQAEGQANILYEPR